MSSDDKGPRRVRVFRAGESRDFVPVIEPGHEIAESDMQGITEASRQGWDNGMSVRVLLVDEVSGFNITHLWMKPFYKLPHHSHDVDCAYYVVSGEAHMGVNVLKSGDSFMVPAHCIYTYGAGPEGCEVIEFRNQVEFTYRLGKHPENFWSKAAAIAQANAGHWASIVPPLSTARVAGEE